jgi:hypothetical protein
VCNWPFAVRQDVKERESSDDGGAGRMTVTARADVGARFEARPKAWVYVTVSMNGSQQSISLNNVAISFDNANGRLDLQQRQE